MLYFSFHKSVLFLSLQLELNGFSIEEGDNHIDPAFLMELMELNETLAETTDLDSIRQIGKENAGKVCFFLSTIQMQT